MANQTFVDISHVTMSIPYSIVTVLKFVFTVVSNVSNSPDKLILFCDKSFL